MINRAFTLVELLVVIAIIAVLMSILTPALSMVKGNGRRVVCASRQKQLGVAFFMYNESYGKFPYGLDENVDLLTDGPFLGSPAWDFRGLWWIDYLMDDDFDQYEDSTCWCPSRKVADQRLDDDILHGNYGVNFDVCVRATAMVDGKFRKSKFLTKIRRPSETLLLVDSGYAMISGEIADLNPPPAKSLGIPFSYYLPGLSSNDGRVERGEIKSRYSQDAIYGRHLSHKINVLFCDGHVESRESDDLGVSYNGTKSSNLEYVWKP